MGGELRGGGLNEDIASFIDIVSIPRLPRKMGWALDWCERERKWWFLYLQMAVTGYWPGMSEVRGSTTEQRTVQGDAWSLSPASPAPGLFNQV